MDEKEFYATFGPGPRAFPSRNQPRPFQRPPDVVRRDREAPEPPDEDLLDITLKILGRDTTREYLFGSIKSSQNVAPPEVIRLRMTACRRPYASPR